MVDHEVNSFDRWAKELSKIKRDANVHYIHTKYMLVDLLGPRPVVVAGSANFSDPSTDGNNENMLVIRNDTHSVPVPDIYVGEFMRLYAHYAIRESVAGHAPKASASTTGVPSISSRQ